VSGDELKALASAKGDELFALMQAWRERRKLPRFVALRDNDNELPIDLDNVLSIEAAVDVLKNRTSAALVEMFTAEEGLLATGPEGRFTHELVVPLVERRPAPAAPTVSAEKPASAAAESTSIRRRFAAGSEWLYVKVYAGPAIVDRLLRNELRHVVDHAVESGACDRWFYIRYGDPDWHVRLRFHGEPSRLLNEVLPLVEQAFARPLDEGWVARVQYDAYEREIERYGGPAGIELAEELFHADSEAALSITNSCGGDEGLDARWRLAVRGADQLLDDLGLSLHEKHALMRALRDEFAQEFGVGADFKQQAGQKFRQERASLESLMNRANDAGSLYEPALAALVERSERLAEIAPRLRRLADAGELTAPLASLAASYVHMWVNRVLRSAHRAQELVLYDFLDRMYQSALSRAAATPSAA
jgi:thiopeptide-type bacteriocin biosynthesis protein